MNETLDIRLSRMDTDSPEPQVFATIQGEGRHTGEPATFIRLSGCNLACSFCDVPETWRFEGTPASRAPHESDEIFRKDQEEITAGIERITDIVVGNLPRHLVITGGEPLIQQDKIINLADEVRLRDPRFFIEIETNGTIAPRPDLIKVIDWFNVSPKLENSGNPLKKRIKPRAMEAFAALPQADFKFVISRDEDIQEVLGLVDLYGIPPSRVFLMPEGRTKEKIEAGQSRLVDFCVVYGFNLSTRLHIFLFGDKRGT